MTRRLTVRLLSTVAVMLIACHLGRAEAAARSSIRVALDTVTVDVLSRIAWQAMTRECSGIWAREGVELLWPAAGAPMAPARVVLPVVFDDHELSSHESQKGAALGVTLSIGRSQRIVVSAPRAERMIAARDGLARPSNVLQRENAIGVLMGRVVAHEIGHALLSGVGHAARGLMRAQFDVGELQPALHGEFALSDAGRRELEARFWDTAPPDPLAQSAFTWKDAPPAPSRLHARR
jgi:hypothetical protein